jgi:hypothetical protein
MEQDQGLAEQRRQDSCSARAVWLARLLRYGAESEQQAKQIADPFHLKTDPNAGFSALCHAS